MTARHELAVSRRDVLRFGLGSAAALALGACSTSPSSTAAGDSASWESIPPYSLQSTDPNRADYLRTQLAAFEDSGRQIEPRVTSTDTAAAMAKLLLQASQGRASDVAQVDGYIFGRLADYASPLDDVMAANDLRLDDWFPGLQTTMTAGGDQVRALQFTTDVRVLYYRKATVPEPPRTWDDVWSIASGGGDGGLVTFPAGRGEGAVTTTLWPLYWGQGADLFDADGKVAFASGTNYDTMVAALGVVAESISSGATPQRVATFGNEDAQIEDVVAGRVSMFLGGNWQAAGLDTAMEGTDFFDEWGVAPLPTLDDTTPVTSAGGWVWAGFAEDEPLATGMDWVVQAYVSDEGMAEWCSIGGYLPPRESVYDLPGYQQNAFTPIFRDHLSQYARPRPGARDYLQTSDSMQIALSSVAAGTATPDQALDDALNRIV